MLPRVVGSFCPPGKDHSGKQQNRFILGRAISARHSRAGQAGAEALWYLVRQQNNKRNHNSWPFSCPRSAKCVVLGCCVRHSCLALVLLPCTLGTLGLDESLTSLSHATSRCACAAVAGILGVGLFRLLVVSVN